MIHEFVRERVFAGLVRETKRLESMGFRAISLVTHTEEDLIGNVQQFFVQVMARETEGNEQATTVSNYTSNGNRRSFSFEQVGIHVGATIHLVGKPGIKAKVLENNKIRFRNADYSLTGAAKIALDNPKITSGPTKWVYEGLTLDARRKSQGF